MVQFSTNLTSTQPLPAPVRAAAAHPPELTHLVQRLTRLVQEMGDRGLEPDAYGPVAHLRGPYVQLSQQATRLIERLGLATDSAGGTLGDMLIAELRATSRGQRRARMSVPEALQGA